MVRDNRMRIAAMGRGWIRAVAFVLVSGAAAWFVGAENLRAVTTERFVIDSAEDFSSGELDGAQVLSSGAIGAAVKSVRIPVEAAVTWSVLRWRGDVFLGTGNEGAIYRVRGDSVKKFAHTGELLVTDLVGGRSGELYAATIAAGKVFRVSTTGAVKLFCELQGADHVWSLAWDKTRGRLLAATGPQGKLFSIDAKGRASELWDSEEPHLMKVVLDGDGLPLVGTSGDGLLVRVKKPGSVRVVYDFEESEITDMAAVEGGVVVAVNAFKTPRSAKKGESKAPLQASSLVNASKPGVTGAVGTPKDGKGALYWVSLDGEADLLLRDKSTHFNRVWADDKRGLYYAASAKGGRIHRVTRDRESSIWVDVEEEQVLGMDLTGTDPVFVTADSAAMYRVQPKRAKLGTWTSKVLDAKFTAHFGRLDWRGNGKVLFQTRTGNRSTPDDTWSPWSKPMVTPGVMTSPRGRFLQMRAEFAQSSDARVHAVMAYYVPRNQRARVQDVTTKRQPAPGAQRTRGKNKLVPPVPSSTYNVSWKVKNPDSDPLRFFVHYKRESLGQWRDMFARTEPLLEPKYEWDTSGLADGYYLVRVTVSDERGNPPGKVLTHSARSEPVLIDNHPPLIQGLQYKGGRVVGRVYDRMGPIVRLEVAKNGQDFLPVHPVDGVLDSADESFSIPLEGLVAGTHVVAVRASDLAQNHVTSDILVRLR